MKMVEISDGEDLFSPIFFKSPNCHNTLICIHIWRGVWGEWIEERKSFDGFSGFRLIYFFRLRLGVYAYVCWDLVFGWMDWLMIDWLDEPYCYTFYQKHVDLRTMIWWTKEKVICLEKRRSDYYEKKRGFHRNFWCFPFFMEKFVCWQNFAFLNEFENGSIAISSQPLCILCRWRNCC